MFSLTITFMLSCLYGRSTTVVTQARRAPFIEKARKSAIVRPRYCAQLTKLGLARSIFRPDAKNIEMQCRFGTLLLFYI